MQFKNKFSKIILILCGLLVLILAGVVLLYASSAQAVSVRAIAVLHLPIGRVGSVFVNVGDLKLERDVQPSEPVVKAEFIKQTKSIQLKAVAKSLGVDQTGSGEDVEARIRTKWYGNEQLNTQSWQKAKSLKTRLEAGEDFASLAKTNSGDLATKSFGGDAGYLLEGSLVPEYREKILTMKEGDTAIIASRQALHVVRLGQVITADGESEKRYHIYDIALTNTAVEGWLKQELNAQPVRYFLVSN